MPSRLIVTESENQIGTDLFRDGEARACLSSGPYAFRCPLSDRDLEDLRWYLEDYLTLPYAVYEDRGQAIAARLPRWGGRLFDVLFGPDRPGHEPYGQAWRDGPPALSLVSDSPRFLALPWELLHDPARPTPLALDLAGIDRRTRTPAKAAERWPGDVLRVLMVIARPYGRQDVRFRMAARPLLAQLEAVAGRVELEVLRPPTLAALRRRLATAAAENRPYAIVHFDGHGIFEDPDGSGRHGYLLFETDTGDEDRIDAEDVALALAGGGVPLLVLNACQSGMVAGAVAAEAAVAARLIAHGTAAVVAMGYSVYADAAAEFTAAFYEGLFTGKTVAQAVTLGRRQLHRENRRPSLTPSA